MEFVDLILEVIDNGVSVTQLIIFDCDLFPKEV